MRSVRALVSIPSVICIGLFILGGESQAARVIPLEYRDGLIWVKVRTSTSAAPLNFLLDSGAGASVLNLPTAHRLGVRLGLPEKVRRVGASASAWRAMDFHADVAGIPVAQNPLALDLSETSAACSRSIDGLLGADFFSGRIVEIDFKAGCIRLLDKADAGACCAVMPLKLEHSAMCVRVSVNGSALKWARLDTGCDDGLHWVDGTGGGYVRTSLQLGGERISNVRTALHRSAIFPSESGLLGNGVLSGYRVIIDGVTGRLLLARA